MKLQIKQVLNELHNKRFEIVEIDGTILGTVTAISALGIEEFKLRGDYGGLNKISLDNYKGVIDDNKFKSYTLSVNGENCGDIATVKYKKFFTEYDYIQLHYNKTEYTLYVIPLGELGTKICVYTGITQIGLAETTNKDCNESFWFDLSFTDSKHTLAMIILTLYYYCTNHYNPDDTQLVYNKKLWNKFNSKFKEECV